MQKSKINATSISIAIRQTVAEWLRADTVQRVEQIGSGGCYDFADDVVKLLGFGGDERDITIVTEGFWKLDPDEEDARISWTADLDLWRKAGEPVPVDIPTEELEDLLGSATHIWFHVEGKHFDAEAPDGVDHALHLPFFSRQINGLRKELQERGTVLN